MVTSLDVLLIPPPFTSAEFLTKAQSVIIESLEALLSPPPKKAEFSEKVQSVTVGLLLELHIPPPILSAEFA
jgi:hypothetical protein